MGLDYKYKGRSVDELNLVALKSKMTNYSKCTDLWITNYKKYWVYSREVFSNFAKNIGTSSDSNASIELPYAVNGQKYKLGKITSFPGYWNSASTTALQINGTANGANGPFWCYYEKGFTEENFSYNYYDITSEGTNTRAVAKTRLEDNLTNNMTVQKRIFFGKIKVAMFNNKKYVGTDWALSIWNNYTKTVTLYYDDNCGATSSGYTLLPMAIPTDDEYQSSTIYDTLKGHLGAWIKYQTHWTGWTDVPDALGFMLIGGGSAGTDAHINTGQAGGGGGSGAIISGYVDLHSSSDTPIFYLVDIGNGGNGGALKYIDSGKNYDTIFAGLAGQNTGLTINHTTLTAGGGTTTCVGGIQYYGYEGGKCSYSGDLSEYFYGMNYIDGTNGGYSYKAMGGSQGEGTGRNQLNLQFLSSAEAYKLVIPELSASGGTINGGGAGGCSFCNGGQGASQNAIYISEHKPTDAFKLLHGHIGGGGGGFSGPTTGEYGTGFPGNGGDGALILWY